MTLSSLSRKNGSFQLCIAVCPTVINTIVIFTGMVLNADQFFDQAV